MNIQKFLHHVIVEIEVIAAAATVAAIMTTNLFF
jgi:hypothetical protein